MKLWFHSWLLQVDKLEDDLVQEMEKLRNISEEVEATFVELSGY